jgi:hypothetical protein
LKKSTAEIQARKRVRLVFSELYENIVGGTRE